MKAIIDGKRYDTDTAELVAGYSVGASGDFEREEEALYKTHKGAWFTAGEGGPRSSYATHYRNESRGGAAIRPLTEALAQQWLEDFNKVEELESFFCTKVEDA